MKSILCYGDSNTYGQIPLWKDPEAWEHHRYDENTRWPMVAQRILGNGYRIIEEGLCGRSTVYDMIKQPFCRYCNGLLYLPGILMTHAPLDLVVIMLGTNDLHSVAPPDEKTLGHGIERLVDEVRSLPECGRGVSVPPILLIAPPHFRKALGRTEVYEEFRGERGVLLSRLFAPVYKEIADRKGCFFLDAALYAEPSDADGLHLEAESHIALGKAAAEAIAAVFQEVII